MNVRENILKNHLLIRKKLIILFKLFFERNFEFMNADYSIKILNQKITADKIREVLQNAIKVNWGTHLIRWRYEDIEHEGIPYKKGDLITTDLWHLLKRIYVDKEWPTNTTMEDLSKDARTVICNRTTEIWVYGYYRTSPPRIQWGFYLKDTGIAVVYDEQADLIATVFKPVEGSKFFAAQISAQQINRKQWGV